jgi:hypothetical protein
LALVLGMTLPAAGVSQTQIPRPLGIQKPSGIQKPLGIQKAKTFTPAMSFLVRNYRLMAAYAKVWKNPGVRTVKAPRFTIAIARTWATTHQRPMSNNNSDVTYTVAVDATDVTRNGTSTYTQTITTTGSNGSSYADSMSSTTDANGVTTETQSVTATDADGTTTSESLETTTTPNGRSDIGGGLSSKEWCWGILCAAVGDCCVFCPKAAPCASVTINYY